MISTGASSPLNVYGVLYCKIMHKYSIALHRKSGNSIRNALLRQYNLRINSVMLLPCLTLAFDTTSSNTGLKSGACTLLEDKIAKRLLSFACRHHMFEIVLEQVFSLTLPAASTGPDVHCATLQTLPGPMGVH